MWTSTTPLDAKGLWVTMGDPCGVGPELIARACLDGVLPLDQLRIAACPEVMRRAFAVYGAAMPEGLPICRPDPLPQGLSDLPMGQVHAAAGLAAARCIEVATQALMAGQGGGMVTAPIHKEALGLAGLDFPGHTEMLQAWSGSPQVRMMLLNPQLRTVLVTIHQSLRQAIQAIDQGRVLDTIVITHQALRQWGIEQPRIAVAGLNPHAGEGGRFGHEEIEHIAPAVALARQRGIDATGPWAPDTVFMRARHAPPDHPGEFDAVVSMVHDHGLIAVKYLGVDDGVNVSLGLPFVRTSPDHGTAFDLAGTGRVRTGSFQCAVEAALLALGRLPTRSSAN